MNKIIEFFKKILGGGDTKLIIKSKSNRQKVSGENNIVSNGDVRVEHIKSQKEK